MDSVASLSSYCGTGHQSTLASHSSIMNQYLECLVSAACNNDIKQVIALIHSGQVSVDAVNSAGFTALMYASMNGHISVVKKLIELNANVNYQHSSSGDSALHFAAQCGHTRTAEVLIQQGNADITLQNRAGKNAYDVCKDFGHGNNKIMRRLFDTFNHPNIASGNSGASLGSGGGSSSSSLLSNSSQHNQPMTSVSQSTKSSKRIQKDNSPLPCKALLNVLAETGLYRLLSSGNGFALIAKTGNPYEMIQEACINLEIENFCIEQLQTRLSQIVIDFETNDNLIAEEKYLSGSGSRQRVPNSNSRYTQQNSNAQYQDSGRASALNNYLQWKDANVKSIKALIDVLSHISRIRQTQLSV